jgi:heme-degrading monooxygenase HmoA
MMKIELIAGKVYTPNERGAFQKSIARLTSPVRRGSVHSTAQFAMILEVAILDIGRGTCDGFEAAFREASPIITSMPGYVAHELRRCMEKPSRYILLVKWQTLEDHTAGFRQSAGYQRWRALLHDFYDPFPAVEHYDSPGVRQNSLN